MPKRSETMTFRCPLLIFLRKIFKFRRKPKFIVKKS
jgi:hypothetical protein